jgi:hypothetical protein
MKVQLDILSPNVNHRWLFIFLDSRGHFDLIDNITGELTPECLNTVRYFRVVSPIINNIDEGARRISLVIVNSLFILLGEILGSSELGNCADWILIVY